MRAEKRQKSLRRWQSRWDRSQKGRWTHRLIPNISLGIERRHGEVDYHLTQLLTGHGYFKHHSQCYDQNASANCPACPHTVENAEHVLHLLTSRRPRKIHNESSQHPQDVFLHGCAPIDGRLQNYICRRCTSCKNHRYRVGTRRRHVRAKNTDAKEMWDTLVSVFPTASYKLEQRKQWITAVNRVNVVLWQNKGSWHKPKQTSSSTSSTARRWNWQNLTRSAGSRRRNSFTSSRASRRRYYNVCDLNPSSAI
ncbi:unnamed protein product [Trichogramma brassicae]|uniref:Uncharacterized protein n=1 Tax=Trichogramma brassicae TaxID=86971 RepID=A0A6H5J2C7_9HYME|nr:unnamed protein product [Trichogramma brassicae]